MLEKKRLGFGIRGMASIRERDCRVRSGRVGFSRHTRESVQSPLVVLKLKVRKGGDFFYGKSSNENHFEGV